MSARLMKKVLKEQEAALQHQELNSEDDSLESVDLSPPTRNHFDLLELDNGEDSNSGDRQYHCNSDQEKGKVACEAIDFGITCKYSSAEKDAVGTVLMPKVESTKKKKKKKKKKKIREDLFLSTEIDVRSSNQMLANLTLGPSSSDHPQVAPYSSIPKLVHVDGDDKMLKKQCKSSVLQVDPKYLSAENELRRIFGSRVVKSYERSHLSVNSRPFRGGRRGNHNFKRTILVSPSQHWPAWDGSLSMELVETRDGVHYFRK